MRDALDDLGPAGAASAGAESISIQEAWEAAGGNPAIKANRNELLTALRHLNEVRDEAEESGLSVRQMHERLRRAQELARASERLVDVALEHAARGDLRGAGVSELLAAMRPLHPLHTILTSNPPS